MFIGFQNKYPEYPESRIQNKKGKNIKYDSQFITNYVL